MKYKCILIFLIRKISLQILLITIPGFFINYILILWYLASVNKLLLKTTQWLLFSAILMSSDPMLTAAAVRDLGLSRSLVNLINGESLMTSIMSLILFDSIVDVNFSMQRKTNYSLNYSIMTKIWSYFLASFLFGILSSKLIQLWMATVFGDDVNHISLSFSILYFIFFFCELVGMSGIFTLAIMGLFLNSTSFKPGVEAPLLEFWNCLSFVAFLMVFTFVGLLIPAHTYLYVSFSDVYYSLNVYLTLMVFRLLVFLLISPLLSRLGHGFSWRWAFIMVWSEMKGTPNINMALLIAYSESSLGSEREKSQILFHGVSVCLIGMIINRFILPMAVSELGLRDVTSTRCKSLYYTFQHFQELTKSAASALKFDKDLANADWNIVEEAIILQNPYALSQGETTEHQKVRCLDCNKEIDETLNIEAMELANRRLLSAQIASYQRQYRDEILSQSEVQVLVGAAGSFGEKGEYINADTIKNYSESKKILVFTRKVLLNWVYNTKKEKGIPSSHCFLRGCHRIVFADEFEYVGYLVTLMNIFPIIISWIPGLNVIYEHELRHANYFFLAFYIVEALLKVAAMRKEYFLHAWNLFELTVTLVGIIDVMLIETNATNSSYYLIQTVVFIKIVRFLRILRILKLVTPKLLQVIDKNMRHQLSFRYAILKGYVQGEADIMTIIDKIASSKQIKQMLLRRVTKNTGRAMKELGYLEYDHPEIAVTMKTKEEINVMLNLAREIIKVFRLKGILHKIEGSEINKTCFIARNHLYEAFEQLCPHIEYKMWLKIGLSITAKKIREHLSYEDWNYKMQLKLHNIYVRDIPKCTKTDIYDETVIYVILIHGAVEDCQLRKTYKAPFLIPITCHQIQGTEDFTKVMIVQTSIDVKRFRWKTRKDIPSQKPSRSTTSAAGRTDEERSQDEISTQNQHLRESTDITKEEMNIYENLQNKPE
ncbi:solute carrier family 9 member C1 isoform X6 [Camelus bactrianus]|uniref:Solute carrier family 9 member C1 isoform X6 n=1 Tax=Camelus bactrianus TaxID=9837 RepID=A0AC58QAU7_CAMBA